MTVNTTLQAVTDRIVQRSRPTRNAYLDGIAAMHQDPDSDRRSVACSNMAHAAAAADADKEGILATSGRFDANIGIITAYNDMLSAHQPFAEYPEMIKSAARAVGATAQVAGGVPAMCDGVTQGRPGMELSLLSRDVIAMAAGVGLSHGVYDAVICLGVCDKIVPGLVMGALSFGHLPTIFVPAGPMSSGISNDEKAAVRKAFAKGEASRAELLASETRAYHGEGTCTFYGTANSNQMLMEVMGLHLPGAAFVHPQEELRQGLTEAATRQAIAISRRSDDIRPIGKMLDERAFVNAIVGLHATGGSTNHTLHLPAMAAAAGIKLTWQDFADLSDIVPLLARVYPNGSADVNHFHAAGGIAYVIQELLAAGLLHADAETVWGRNLGDYSREPVFDKNHQVVWQAAAKQSLDENILRPVTAPHSATGGLKMLSGSLGKAVIKVSAVAEQHHIVTAPAKVFTSEAAVKIAFEDGLLNQDVVVVVIGQGPRSNGMPELHKLTPLLSILQEQGHAAALVTDGRMSGASGKVPAAIHVCPEALAGGNIGKLQDGDLVTVDAVRGTLEVDAELTNRAPFAPTQIEPQEQFGRGLFAGLRGSAAPAEEGGGLNPLASMTTSSL